MGSADERRRGARRGAQGSDRQRAGATRSRQTRRAPPLPKQLRAALAALDTAEGETVLELDGARIAVTHLDKVLWPASGSFAGYTRRDYLRYLLAVAPHVLRHLRERPLTLIRQPAGVAGRRFVHFHYEQPLPPFVETVDIHSEKSGRPRQYLLCNNAATLVWLAHVGCLEFHGWHSRADAPDRPDYIVCDLDPYIYAGTEAKGAQPDFSAAAFARCAEIALALKAILDEMSLESFVKTSGRTGLHVLVPVDRTISYDAARALAATLGGHLMSLYPKVVTMDVQVSRRAGRIFFDAGMNARVKTLAAPYSTRGIAGAPVAMPLEWDEVGRANPLDYTLATVPRILERRGDIWARLSEAKQDIAAVLRVGV